MTNKKKSLLEMLVEDGFSTEKIMEWKDYWDWKEETQEDINENIKKLKVEN